MTARIPTLTTLLLGLTSGLLLTGCGGTDGPELAPVSGKVTLNGKPLANAVVMFQPEGPEGTCSTARTDDEGCYELRFTRDRHGAMVGTHRISVSTAAPDAEDENGNPRPIPEQVPAHYNIRTTLVRDVSTEGNVIDLPLIGTKSIAAGPKRRY